MSGSMWHREFNGRRVVITGAAGTFGGWFAKAFLDAGASVFLTDADSTGLSASMKSLVDHKSQVHSAVIDITDESDVKNLSGTIRDQIGAPDIVINSAGVFPSGHLMDLDAEVWDRIMGVNLRGPFLISRHLARLMIESDINGSVINITSASARTVRPGNVAYCVSKAALHQLTIGLSLELAEFGIRVNSVEPGYAPRPGTPKEVIERVKEAMPLKAVGGPDDTAAAVMFLASSQARLITGAFLNVDGGWPLTPAAVDPSFNNMSGGDNPKQ